jgi:hypothetical protein
MGQQQNGLFQPLPRRVGIFDNRRMRYSLAAASCVMMLLAGYLTFKANGIPEEIYNSRLALYAEGLEIAKLSPIGHRCSAAACKRPATKLSDYGFGGHAYNSFGFCDLHYPPPKNLTSGSQPLTKEYFEGLLKASGDKGVIYTLFIGAYGLLALIVLLTARTTILTKSLEQSRGAAKCACIVASTTLLLALIL